VGTAGASSRSLTAPACVGCRPRSGIRRWLRVAGFSAFTGFVLPACSGSPGLGPRTVPGGWSEGRPGSSPTASDGGAPSLSAWVVIGVAAESCFEHGEGVLGLEAYVTSEAGVGLAGQCSAPDAVEY